MGCYWKYFKYLMRHKWFVLLASWKLGAPLFRAIIHDWTKFLPSEFIPYAQHFYWPTKKCNEEAMRAFALYGCAEAAPYGFFLKDRFNIAWNLHQKRNKHHWEYWVLINDRAEHSCMPMPHKYILEMVADWAGAGRAITGKWEYKAWWKRNKDTMRMRWETSAIIEEMMHE